MTDGKWSWRPQKVWGLAVFGSLVTGPVWAKMDIRSQGSITQVKFCDASIRENTQLRMIINGQVVPIKAAPNSVDLMCTEWTSLSPAASRPGTSIKLERFGSSGSWSEVETRTLAGTPNPSVQPTRPAAPPTSVVNARMTLSIPASGVAQAQVCGLPANTRVGFQIEDSSGDEYQVMNQIAGSDGCATQRYANGLLKNGMRVKASFNGMSLSERVQTTSVPVVPPRPQPTPVVPPRPQPTASPAPRPLPTAAPTATPVPKVQVNPNDLSRAGVQAAQIFIEDVIEIYATLEQAQLSYRLGFRASQREFESVFQYSSLPAYATGVQEGQARGQRDGASNGTSRGERDGSEAGRRDATSRFKSIVGTDRLPDRDLKPVQVVVPDFNASNSQPATIEERFRAAVPAFRQEMVNQMRIRSILWGDGDFTRLFVDDFDFTSRTFTSALRNVWGSDPAAEAFAFWARKSDRNLRNRGDELRRYINEVTSSRYASPEANMRIFRQAFERQFEENFGRQWNQRVSQVDTFAFVYGQQQYQTIRSAYARDLGAFAGYRTVYSSAAESAFRTSFERGFTMSFSQEVNSLESSSRITTVEIRSVNRSAVNGREAAPGDVIDIQVGVENIGRQAENLPIRVNGVELGTVRSEKSSRAAFQSPQGVVLPVPTELFSRRSLVATGAVRVTVGQQVRDISYSTSYGTIIRTIATANSPQIRERSLKLVIESLKAEWNELTNQAFTQYDSPTLLSETRSVIQSMGLAERQALKAMGFGEALRETIGDQPWWWAGYKGDWNEANALIDSIVRQLN